MSEQGSNSEPALGSAPNYEPHEEKHADEGSWGEKPAWDADLSVAAQVFADHPDDLAKTAAALLMDCRGI